MTTLADSSLELNTQQHRAATHRGAPLIVLAGPGTGKTRVIIARIAHLIEHGADPASILAVTFTVRAAEQMRIRLVGCVGRAAAEGVLIHTFHAYGSRIVARFGDCVGVPPVTRIIDSTQEKRSLASIARDPETVPDRGTYSIGGLVDRARHFVDSCRSAAKSPEEAIRFAREWADRLEHNDESLEPRDLEAERVRASEFTILAKMYERFEGECIANGNLSFDHYITLPIRIMREVKAAASIIHSEIRHVVVDEFQDVNSAQVELLRCIAPPGSPTGLCVVGDDDQSIYGFRGSDPRAFAHGAEIWGGAETVPLVENYRSTKPILDLSNAFVTRTPERFSPEKEIVAAGERAGMPAEPVRLLMLQDDHDAGAIIARLIEQDRAATNDDPSKYAVIARTHAQLQRISVQLQLAGLPTQYRTVATLLDDPAVRDVLSWIRVLVDPHDIAEALRLLGRPPLGAELSVIHDVYHRYRAASGAAAHRGGEGFVVWLRGQPDNPAPVARFLELFDRLWEVARSETADRAVFSIVQATGLADLDPLPGPEQARRIDHLAQVVRFVRKIVERLEATGDLREFAEYYADLDASEQAFSMKADSRLDGEADDDAGVLPGAVSLLTAHGAKGLEFESVYLPYVRKGGFPGSPRASAFDRLPASFTGTPDPDHATEERRLFYVAMTRAQRKLVLLSGERKSKVEDYCSEMGELTSDGLIEIASAEEALDDPDTLLADGLTHERADAGQWPEDALERSRSEVRASIFSLLHRATSDAIDADEFARVQEHLSLEVEKLAALARSGAERDDEFVDALRDETKQFLESERRREKELALPTGLKLPKPPLDLSFTALNLYDRCPRCYLARYVLHLPERFGDPVIVGSVVHAALERFYKEFAIASSEGADPHGLGRLLELGELHFRSQWPAYMAEDTDQREHVAALLRRAYEDLHHDTIHVLEVEHNVRRMPLDVDGTEHFLTAKMDRIDQIEDERGLMYRVVDYKTGHPSKKYLEPARTDLQLGIYTKALSHLFGHDQETPPGVAEYWVLAEGRAGTIDLSEINMKSIDKKISKLVRGILEGAFERGSACSHACDLLG